MCRMVTLTERAWTVDASHPSRTHVISSISSGSSPWPGWPGRWTPGTDGSWRSGPVAGVWWSHSFQTSKPASPGVACPCGGRDWKRRSYIRSVIHWGRLGRADRLPAGAGRRGRRRLRFVGAAGAQVIWRIRGACRHPEDGRGPTELPALCTVVTHGGPAPWKGAWTCLHPVSILVTLTGPLAFPALPGGPGAEAGVTKTRILPWRGSQHRYLMVLSPVRTRGIQDPHLTPDLKPQARRAGGLGTAAGKRSSPGPQQVAANCPCPGLTYGGHAAHTSRSQV